MKQKLNLFLTAFSAFVCLSCSGSDDNTTTGNTDNTLTVSPTELQVKARAASYQVAVTASRGEWTSYSAADWVTVTNANTNTSKGTITVNVAENKGTAARETTITVKSGTSRATVVVKQGAPLLLSQTRIVTGSVGEKVSVTVTSSEAWSVSTKDSWISVSKTNDTTFDVTTAANDAQSSRTGKVTVATESQTVDVEVYQESVADRTMTIPDGYRLVWHDEFDGNSLGSDWVQEAQPAGWGNNELQTYIKGSSVNEVANGKLNIHCYKGSDGKIYSGRVYAKPSTGWTYGYFEARILLPKGKGTWPAFWMMPSNNDFNTNPWPRCGEIDIMEEVGAVPNEVSSSLHTQDYNHTKGTQKTHAMTLPDAEGAYHVYALEWTPETITTYVDGNVQLAVTKAAMGSGQDQWPFHYAFYPIFNLAWGGSWGGMNGVDESALPVTMQVDYIRIFQK